MADSKPIRVLHVTATTTGGVGLMILHLVRHMDRRQFALSVAFGRDYFLDQTFDEAGVPVFTLSTSRGFNPLAMLTATWQLCRILRRERFDIVQSHTSAGGVIARLAGWAARVPVALWTVHGLGAHAGLVPWKRRLVGGVERILDCFTDHYVAVSTHLLDEGVRSRTYRAEKVTVIPNGLDLGGLPTEFDAASKRKALGIPDGSPVIGTVTRLEPQKAIDWFVRACAAVASEVPDVVILIAGDGPMRPKIEQLSSELGLGDRIRLLGWRTDAVELLGVMDVFCLTSRWEGCPMVLLEAMAMQCPVVATKIGGVSEIVVDEQTGLLVDASDPAVMAKAIVRLLSDTGERERMGLAGRRRVEQDYAAETMYEAYAQLYRRLIAATEPAAS